MRKICAKVTRDDILEHWCFVERHLKDSNPPKKQKPNPSPKSTAKVMASDMSDDEDIDMDMDRDKSTKNEKVRAKDDEKEGEGHWLGNGYPGHEKTKQFLQAVHRVLLCSPLSTALRNHIVFSFFQHK